MPADEHNGLRAPVFNRMKSSSRMPSFNHPYFDMVWRMSGLSQIEEARIVSDSSYERSIATAGKVNTVRFLYKVYDLNLFSISPHQSPPFVSNVF